MNTSDTVIVCNKPLKTAALYDFYMFLQLVTLILLCISVGKMALFIDRKWKVAWLTPKLITGLEAISKVSVLS
jgi:hypothetical protein